MINLFILVLVTYLIRWDDQTLLSLVVMLNKFNFYRVLLCFSLLNLTYGKQKAQTLLKKWISPNYPALDLIYDSVGYRIVEQYRTEYRMFNTDKNSQNICIKNCINIIIIYY